MDTSVFDAGFDPFVLVPFLFMGIGALFVVLGIFFRRRGKAQSAWPTVQGTVQSASVHHEQRRGTRDRGEVDRYYARAAYTYSVAGKSYEGSTVGGVQGLGTTKAAAESAVAELPAGAAVPVYYDPADPAKSVLRPSKGGCQTMAMIAIGALLFAVGAAFVAIYASV